VSALAVREPAEAREPAELRGHGRDDVRLLVAHRDGFISRARFAELPELLAPGDLLAINTSATLPAAIPVRGAEPDLRVHLSSPAPERGGGAWLVELRRGGERFRGGDDGDVLLLPDGATAVLLERDSGGRLWLVQLQLPAAVPR
jgi:S-adenosylmethionine:tRNA ribosyltransferase-isomerase